MKDLTDKATAELPLVDGAPKRRRGRPPVHGSASARSAAYLARHELVQVNVRISQELKDALDGYMARQAADGPGLTQSQVIEKLLRTQLLRKR